MDYNIFRDTMNQCSGFDYDIASLILGNKGFYGAAIIYAIIKRLISNDFGV